MGRYSEVFFRGRGKLRSILESSGLTGALENISTVEIHGSSIRVRAHDADIDYFLEQLGNVPVDSIAGDDRDLLFRAIESFSFASMLRRCPQIALREESAEVLNISNNLFIPSPEVWFSNEAYSTARRVYSHLARDRGDAYRKPGLRRIEIYSTRAMRIGTPTARLFLLLHWCEELAMNGCELTIVDNDSVTPDLQDHLRGLDLHMTAATSGPSSLFRHTDTFGRFQSPFGSSNAQDFRNALEEFEDLARSRAARRIAAKDLPDLGKEWGDDELSTEVESWVDEHGKMIRAPHEIAGYAIRYLPGEHPLEHRNSTMQRIAIFVSHSSKDLELARAFVHFLESGLALTSSVIRCSSVPGYGLATGAHTASQLRGEIINASAIVGLVTPASVRSNYVLFELGAAWGTQKPTFACLARGAGPDDLPAPLKEHHAADLTAPASVAQLLDDFVRIDGIERSSRNNVYIQDAIQRLVIAATQRP